MTRNGKILRRAGKKSYGLIAKELGLTRGVVAGVIWRGIKWPLIKRKALGSKAMSPNAGHNNYNKCGNDYGYGVYAPHTMPLGALAHSKIGRASCRERV